MINRRIAVLSAALTLGLTPVAAASSTFPDDHQFIVNATQSNLAEIATGRLALEESDTSAVRAYARKMIADHTKAQAKLSAIAKAWKTTVPTRPSPVQRREAARLEALSGDAFDRRYMLRQVVDHRKALATMLLELDRGQVTDLRNFAAATAPVVRMHLAMAKTTRANL